jgi:hypothetical protein
MRSRLKMILSTAFAPSHGLADPAFPLLRVIGPLWLVLERLASSAYHLSSAGLIASPYLAAYD